MCASSRVGALRAELIWPDRTRRFINGIVKSPKYGLLRWIRQFCKLSIRSDNQFLQRHFLPPGPSILQFLTAPMLMKNSVGTSLRRINVAGDDEACGDARA